MRAVGSTWLALASERLVANKALNFATAALRPPPDASFAGAD